jgi:hypothetical protein
MIPLAVSQKPLSGKVLREREGAGLVPGLVFEGEHAEDLARIAEAWPRLPESVKSAVRSLLHTARHSKTGKGQEG